MGDIYKERRMKTKCYTYIGVILASCVLLNGCGTTSKNSDPFEKTNRKFYAFNDAIDKKFVQPVAETYVKITPGIFRDGVTNFFDNLGYINTISNDILQGKINYAAQDSARFILNSTIGLGGLFDPATKVGLEKRSEDLGQTLAVWGASEGSYLMLPLMGPSSGRDITSPVMSMATNPLTYIASVVTIPVGFLKAVNSRANLLDATRMRDQAALDPYTFVREAWRQKRNYDIFDGNPPTEDDNFDRILDGESDIGILKVY